MVNDLSDPGDVVKQILREGGDAIGVRSSVDNGAHIVQQALGKYGHVDILINNAGFVRDKSFVKMDDDLWDSILNVHLNGTYQMTKAVWPYFVRQRHGVIVNTTSTSGIYGNFGQANYSTAVRRAPFTLITYPAITDHVIEARYLRSVGGDCSNGAGLQYQGQYHCASSQHWRLGCGSCRLER